MEKVYYVVRTNGDLLPNETAANAIVFLGQSKSLQGAINLRKTNGDLVCDENLLVITNEFWTDHSNDDYALRMIEKQKKEHAKEL